MGRKFVASYSGGKDSILAFYRAISQGLEPIALITTYNKDKGLSWFHGISEEVLKETASSLGVPLWLIETKGENYSEKFLDALHKAKEAGAELCVFGDIDIEEHFLWCSNKCENAGIEALFPLWKENRKALVYEFIDAGFVGEITVVDTKRLDETFLGRVLTKETVEEIAAGGADICGENGEYHTFVSDGPIFSYPIDVEFGVRENKDDYVILPVSSKRQSNH